MRIQNLLWRLHSRGLHGTYQTNAPMLGEASTYLEGCCYCRRMHNSLDQRQTMSNRGFLNSQKPIGTRQHSCACLKSSYEDSVNNVFWLIQCRAHGLGFWAYSDLVTFSMDPSGLTLTSRISLVLAPRLTSPLVGVFSCGTKANACWKAMDEVVKAVKYVRICIFKFDVW